MVLLFIYAALGGVSRVTTAESNFGLEPDIMTSLRGTHPSRRSGLEGRIRALSAAALLVAACSSRAPEQPSSWGSDQANLTISNDRALVQFLASGGCYGSFAETDQVIPPGAFAVAGTFTQLMGAAPGSVRYPAELAPI